MAKPTIEEIADNFELIEDWEDRYRYLIELGKGLEPLDIGERTDANKVRGCASQVWLVTTLADRGGQALTFRGDSDAHIVRGLIAILIAMFSGKTPAAIAATDHEALFAAIGLRDHLTPQRSNGLASMVSRIKADAAAFASISADAKAH